MKCEEIINNLEQLAPTAYAEEWDNVGLLAGTHGHEVKRVMVALDATDEVVDAAIHARVDLLLTHHPLIFKPIKKINDQNFITRRIVKLLQSRVACYAMHTNFDCAPGCMADLAAERLELTGRKVLSALGSAEDKAEYGIGKTGCLPRMMTLEELGAFVKARFELPFLTVYGSRLIKDRISFVAIAPGSGKSTIEDALQTGAKVLITGDIGHHEGMDAAERGMAVMDAGHYGLEHIFIDFMIDYLKQEFGDELEILRAPSSFPAVMI